MGGTKEKEMKGKENKQPPNRPILLTGVQIKSHMISDSAGHVARSWSGLPAGRKSQCVTAQRAFLSPFFLFFFPSLSFLLYCECVTLRSGPRSPQKTAIAFLPTSGCSDSHWKMLSS